uniref:Uncharacterized protein n=1 Tax=Anguilla anguilla TaxID=7936 RepID=A0A0E9XCP0_ANGAN
MCLLWIKMKQEAACTLKQLP